MHLWIFFFLAIALIFLRSCEEVFYQFPGTVFSPSPVFLEASMYFCSPTPAPNFIYLSIIPILILLSRSFFRKAGRCLQTQVFSSPYFLLAGPFWPQSSYEFWLSFSHNLNFTSEAESRALRGGFSQARCSVSWQCCYSPTPTAVLCTWRTCFPGLPVMQNRVELGFLKILYVCFWILCIFLSQKTAVSTSVRQGLGNIKSLFPFLLVCSTGVPSSCAFCQQGC